MTSDNKTPRINEPGEMGKRFVPYYPQIDGFELQLLSFESRKTVSEVFSCAAEVQNRSADRFSYPVLPDTCAAIVFQRSDSQTKGWYCGVSDRLKRVDLESGDQVLIFRLNPGCSLPVEGKEDERQTNGIYALDGGVAGSSELLAVLEQSLPLEETTAKLASIVKDHRVSRDVDQLIDTSIDLILQTSGNLRISELARKTGFSERYIGKIFEKFVGLSPKLFAETVRMQRAIRKILDSEKKDSLLEISMDCGYYDHAHMNREFNKFLGCSAGMLRRKGFEAIDLGSADSCI